MLNIHCILIDYLERKGFKVVRVDLLYNVNIENTYNAVCRDYDRFIFLEWSCDANFPSVKVFECGDKSTQYTRSLIGYPYAATLNVFKHGFKVCYIKKYGYLRWYFRPLMKPFFKYFKLQKWTNNQST